MAGTTQLVRAYPFSDFPNDKVNPSILAAEIAASDPAISQPLVSAALSGTTCSLYFDALLVAADVTQLDVLVAAHQGADFASLYQRAAAEAVTSNDTETDTVKVSLETGPLPAGRYQMSWYAEVAATSVVAGTAASVGLFGQLNGGYEIEVGRTANDKTDYVAFSGGSSFLLNAGDLLVAYIAFKRIGASSNPAKVRRARIFLAPQGA